jgi:hypothetical protein
MITLWRSTGEDFGHAGKRLRVIWGAVLPGRRRRSQREVMCRRGFTRADGHEELVERDPKPSSEVAGGGESFSR